MVFSRLAQAKIQMLITSSWILKRLNGHKFSWNNCLVVGRKKIQKTIIKWFWPHYSSGPKKSSIFPGYETRNPKKVSNTMQKISDELFSREKARSQRWIEARTTVWRIFLTVMNFWAPFSSSSDVPETAW